MNLWYGMLELVQKIILIYGHDNDLIWVNFILLQYILYPKIPALLQYEQHTTMTKQQGQASKQL